MPVAAGFSLLKSQIVAALSLGPAAIPPSVAAIISAAVGTTASMGIYPTAPVPAPLAAPGVSACNSAIVAALSLGPGAKQKLVAQIIAQGVAVTAPLAPPAGLSKLTSTIESALSMDKGAKQSAIAQIIAQGVIVYYSMGGVL